MSTPFANPAILTNLIKDMDALQLTRRPLQPHAISEQLNTQQKQLYASMLIAILVSQTISQSQSRLLMLLLHSMGLADDPAPLYDMVNQLNKQELQIFCEMCDQYQLAPCFLMDVLVLCRLDTELNNDQQQSIAELISLLSVSKHTVTDVLQLANEVINPQTLESIMATNEMPDDMPTPLYIEFDYDLLKPWHEFSYQPLSVAQLQEPITHGKWLITDPLEINKECEITQALILFGSKGVLNIHNHGLIVSNSYLQSAAINFNGNNATLSNLTVCDAQLNLNSSELTIIDSKFFAYNDTFKEAVIYYPHGILNIKNSYFSTMDRTAIYNEFGEFNLYNCHFISNNKELNTIFIAESTQFNCDKSTFKDNSSGGGIRVKSRRGIYKITDCIFDGNYKHNSSICVDQLDNDDSDYIEIEKSSFINTKLWLRFDRGRRWTINNSLFKNASVHSNSDECNLFNNCDFDNGDLPKLLQALS